MAEQEVQQHRGWELRSATEPGVALVVLPSKNRHSLRGSLRIHGSGSRGLALATLLKGTRDPTCGALYFITPLTPRAPDGIQNLLESRHPVARLGREIRPRVERATFVIEEDAHRPSPVPGERGGGIHIDRVDIRSLFAIHLDTDEMLVERRCDTGILE